MNIRLSLTGSTLGSPSRLRFLASHTFSIQHLDSKQYSPLHGFPLPFYWRFNFQIPLWFTDLLAYTAWTIPSQQPLMSALCQQCKGSKPAQHCNSWSKYPRSYHGVTNAKSRSEPMLTFFDLPREIRDLIYFHHCGNRSIPAPTPNLAAVPSRKRQFISTTHSLQEIHARNSLGTMFLDPLKVSRQFYAETTLALYSTSRLRFNGINDFLQFVAGVRGWVLTGCPGASSFD